MCPPPTPTSSAWCSHNRAGTCRFIFYLGLANTHLAAALPHTILHMSFLPPLEKISQMLPFFLYTLVSFTCGLLQYNRQRERDMCKCSMSRAWRLRVALHKRWFHLKHSLHPFLSFFLSFFKKMNKKAKCKQQIDRLKAHLEQQWKQPLPTET